MMKLQAIKIESGFVLLALVIFLLSIFPFCWSTIWCLTQKYRNPIGDVVTSSNFSSIPNMTDHNEAVMTVDLKFQLEKIVARKRAYAFTLQTTIIITT